MNALIILLATIALVAMLGFQSLTINSNLKVMAVFNSLLINGANLWLLKVMPGPTTSLEVAAYLIGGPIGVYITLWAFPKVKAWINRNKLPEIEPRTEYYRTRDGKMHKRVVYTVFEQVKWPRD